MGSRNRFGKPDPIKKPSRVTDNMAEFVTKGKLTEAEKRREGRKTKTGRKATPRDAWGDKRPVTKSTGGKDSARQKRIETVRKYNKRAYGGVNPKVTSSGDVGARAIKDRRAKLPDGGQKYKPITESDGPRGGGSKYQSRTQRVKRSYAAGTEGSRKLTTDADRTGFKTGKAPKVTTGKGKRYRSGYMTNKVRGVDPPKGSSRVFEKGPHKRRGNPEGETRVTQRGHKGSVRGGTKTGPGRYSSGTANDTGARRTGGGKTPTKGAGQARSGGGKGGFNAKLLKKGGKIVKGGLKGGIVNALAMHYGDKYISKPVGNYLGEKLGTQLRKLIKPGTAHPKKAGVVMGPNNKWIKKPVANLPSGYKESEKKAFKQTKKWNKVNRKKL